VQNTAYSDNGDIEGGLQRFPESCALTELRNLVLIGHSRITAIPAQISSLKKLKEISVNCSLSSLPKELSELSGLTKLDVSCTGDLGDAPQDEAFPAELGKLKSLRFLALGGRGLRAVPAFVGGLQSLEVLFLTGNENLRDAPQDEPFPAELGRMKSLRELGLSYCGFRAVPAFVGGLQSLEILYLRRNDEQIYATLDVLIEGCPRLHKVGLYRDSVEGPLSPESWAHLEAFEAKLLAKDPNAVVIFEESEDFSSSESE